MNNKQTHRSKPPPHLYVPPCSPSILHSPHLSLYLFITNPNASCFITHFLGVTSSSSLPVISHQVTHSFPHLLPPNDKDPALQPSPVLHFLPFIILFFCMFLALIFFLMKLCYKEAGVTNLYCHAEYFALIPKHKVWLKIDFSIYYFFSLNIVLSLQLVAC